MFMMHFLFYHSFYRQKPLLFLGKMTKNEQKVDIFMKNHEKSIFPKFRGDSEFSQISTFSAIFDPKMTRKMTENDRK